MPHPDKNYANEPTPGKPIIRISACSYARGQHTVYMHAPRPLLHPGRLPPGLPILELGEEDLGGGLVYFEHEWLILTRLSCPNVTYLYLNPSPVTSCLHSFPFISSDPAELNLLYSPCLYGLVWFPRLPLYLTLLILKGSPPQISLKYSILAIRHSWPCLLE